jgi:hypothetical protein
VKYGLSDKMDNFVFFPRFGYDLKVSRLDPLFYFLVISLVNPFGIFLRRNSPEFY